MSGGYEFRNKTRATITNAASPYTVMDSIDSISVDCSGGVVTVQLPLASGNAGRRISVKDANGACQANTITITTSGSDTIDFQTSVLMLVNYMSLIFESNGSSNWEIV